MEQLNENWTNYAIVNQVDKIDYISTSYGEIYFNEKELLRLKAFIIKLLEKRLKQLEQK